MRSKFASLPETVFFKYFFLGKLATCQREKFPLETLEEINFEEKGVEDFENLLSFMKEHLSEVDYKAYLKKGEN